MLKASVMILGAVSLVLTLPSAAAQQDKMLRPVPVPETSEAIIYRDANYRGPAVSVREARPDLGLAWQIKSIRVKSGSWQLCEKRNYGGTCRVVARDTPQFSSSRSGITVQSMRPLVGPSLGQPLVPGNNRSLRGMAAEFYPQPARNGYRVLACPSGNATANCAAQSAERFCSAMGWRRASRQALETVRERVYLADVLCSNTGM